MSRWTKVENFNFCNCGNCKDITSVCYRSRNDVCIGYVFFILRQNILISYMLESREMKYLHLELIC